MEATQPKTSLIKDILGVAIPLALKGLGPLALLVLFGLVFRFGLAPDFCSQMELWAAEHIILPVLDAGVRPFFMWFLLLNLIPLMIWLERKGAAYIQDRPGPNRAHIFGIRLAGMIHNIADVVKLMTKEDVIPGKVKKSYYLAAPFIAMTVALLTYAVIPFADNLVIEKELKPAEVDARANSLIWKQWPPEFRVNEEMTVGEAEAQGLMRVYVNDVSYSIHQAKIIKPDKVVVKGRIEQADVNKYEKVVATWSLPMQAADLGAGFLYIFAISSLAVYAVVLAGWSSNSKYSLLGGLRSSAQMISYEVSIGLAIIGIVMIFGSVRLNDIVQGQGWHFIGYGPDGSFQWVSDTGLIPMWGIIIQPLGFVLYTICAFAETNRNPFDLPEGESEIVAGYHVEYSSMKFALFFMAEYVNILVQAAIITTLFLGGWQVPWLPTPVLAENIGTVMPIIFALNCGLCIGFGILMKRYHMTNQHAWADLRKHEGSVLTKVSFLKGLFFLVLLALCFSSFAPWKWSAWGAPVFTAIVQFGVFLTKLILVAWVFIWVRWTLPRFRYDQLMKLGWQVMLPLALVNLLITGFLLLVIYMTGLS